MQLTSTLFAVTGLLSLAAAMPSPQAVEGSPEGTTITPVSPSDVQSAVSGKGFSTLTVPVGSDTGVYLCTGPGFTENCYHVIAPTGLCLSSGPELQDNISAVGPDAGFNCNFYVDSQCAGANFNVGNPGYGDLTQVLGGFYNDKISSWRCFIN